jgi:putative ABC transport system permease protein
MFDRDRWQEVFQTLKKNKLRTTLTAFGVFWGIFMLVIMLGSGKGLENGVYDGMGDFAKNSVFIWTQRTSVPYKGFPRGRWYNFNNEDTKAMREQIPEIDLLAPRLQVQTWQGEGKNNVVRGLRTGAFNIMGDYPDFNKIDPVLMKEGRFINQIDIDRQRKVAILGARAAEVLFEPGEKMIGEYVRIQGVYFMVVGVFKSMHKGGWAEWQEQSIFLPFTTLQKTYNYGNRVGWYSMTSKAGVSATVLEEKTKEFLKKRHSIAPEDNEAIGSQNMEKEFKKFSGLFKGIATLVWIVGIGTLVAGVIGVSNIMLVIVKERTKEIGIQRAIGAKPWRIISQILTESVFLTSIAGYFGLVCGVGLVELINNLLVKSGAETQMFTRPEVDFGVAVTSLAILVVSGLLAGFIPAQRAVRIKPIDALRSE